MPSPWLSHASLRPHARWLAAVWIGYWVVLFGLTHTPKLPRVPIPMDRRSLVAHFIAYAGLALLCVLVRIARRPDLSIQWKLRWTAIFAAYAAADELLQPLFRRHADPLDWLADVAAVILVMLLVRPGSQGV